MREYDIFISYRREDGKDFARQIQLILQYYGYTVFLDVEELKDGVFDRRVIDAITGSKVFIAILTPRYLSRCTNEDDWVRKEIECAIESNIHIVPINVDRLFRDFPDDCPPSIRGGLGQHQFSEVFTGQQFTNTMRDLDDCRLRPYIKSVKRDSDNQAVISFRPDMDCQMLRNGELIAQFSKGVFNRVNVEKGEHNFEFVSIECEEDRIEKRYKIIYNENYFDVYLSPIKEARLRREEAERKAQEERELQDKTYAVGDYYNRSGKEGIVFEVWDGGKHGKIMSMDEVKVAWCRVEQYDKCIALGTSNDKIGIVNTNLAIARDDSDNYPAFTWCRSKGEGWSLPAILELWKIYNNKELINNTLASLSRQPIRDNYYWSSTERGTGAETHALLIFMTGGIDSLSKNTSFYVRAVNSF